MLGDKRGKKRNQYTADYVVFDLETTGTSAVNDAVIEISAILVQNGRTTDEFSTLVNPERPIPYHASKVNHIYDDMVAQAPLFEKALADFDAFIGDRILVGHNIHTFDMRFLWRDAEKYWGKTIANDYIDTLPLARQCLPQLSNYKLTDLELNMYADIIKDMLDFLGRSWENYITLKFSYVRTETNPTLVQLIGYDDTVVIVGLDIRFPNSSGRLSMCLPGEMLTNIFTEISKQTGHRSTGEDKSEEIFDSLRDSDLEIIAELARTKLQLSDIYHLNVGDVVDIKQPKDAPIFLNISGRRWFDGRMGIYNKQMAVKIGETYIKA